MTNQDLIFDSSRSVLSFDKKQAELGLEKLKSNPYPGRLIILGIDETGDHAIQLYAITGRSPNSKNRILKPIESAGLEVDYFDKNNAGDPSLVIYKAMLQKHSSLGGDIFVVSNGHQTDAIIKGGSFSKNWSYEPDAPNFTPRIAGYTSIPTYQTLKNKLMIISKKNKSNDKVFQIWNLHNTIGLGHCIHTYEGEGNPLPPFNGSPYLVPLKGECKEITEFYWDLLNPNYRVALAVKFISLKNPSIVHLHIINELG